ncbi:MAG: hypothetical protein E7446_05635 [Ruminococcaceae bacterium]|nr:hypothetical protein [Oscillospiraceae bacterium]
MFFNALRVLSQSRRTVHRFFGLDKQGGDGSFVHMENLCADGYPALQTRPFRAMEAQLDRPNGVTAKDALIWVDGNTLCVGGKATGLVLSDSPKQLISMGAYLLIFPDKKWLNTADLSEFGSMENETVTTGTVRFSLCCADGTDYESYLISDTAPVEAQNGALWLDTSAAPVLKRSGDGEWVAVTDTCIKLSAAGIGIGFALGDGVDISGCTEAHLNGSHVLRQVSDDMLVMDGVLSGEGSQSEPVTVRRTVPEMDYVTECGNRIWGCKYGMVNGRAVNEIYASKLGDFKNWRCFEGLSTDSYAASRGSDGAFTAACSYLGYPLFFKEHCIEKVYPAANGAHQIVTLECTGVRRGSHRSLQTVDGTLYYHGIGGVYAFDGSLPVNISAALPYEGCTDAVGGAWQGRYYLSLRDDSGAAHLLVYDTRRRLWHREDGTQAVGFACRGGDIFCLCSDGALLSLRGGAEEEDNFTWCAETGELGQDVPQHKYLNRMAINAQPAAGGYVVAYVSYDQGRTWQRQGELFGRGFMEGALLYIQPRRCAHLRLKLQGVGACTVHSLSAVYEKGSDVT